VLLTVTPTAYIGFTLTAQTCTESLVNDRSVPDSRSYSLYQVLTLTVQTYTESLLNNGSAPDGHSYSLYRVFTLIAKPTRRLLKDGSPLDGSDNLYRVLTLTANSYNLHRALTLTTKKRCRDIKMNHSGASSVN